MNGRTHPEWDMAVLTCAISIRCPLTRSQNTCALHGRRFAPLLRITRQREHVRAGNIVKSQTETAYLITSLPKPDPEHILLLNRHHWKIEAMHRDKDVTLGEDGYTNRSDNAPRNIFVLTSAARTLLKRISNSPTKAIEMVQDDRNRAVRFISDQKNRRPLKRPG